MGDNKTRLEEIYAAVLPEMKARNIEDTTENRLSFLTGVRDAWRENEVSDPLVALDKALYMMTINFEILALTYRLRRKDR